MQGKLDVIRTANTAIAAGGDLEQITQRFITNIKPQLRTVLPQFKAENARYFDEKLKQPLASSLPVLATELPGSSRSPSMLCKARRT